MSTFAHPLASPGLRRSRRRSVAPGLLAVALMPGVAATADAVPALPATTAQARLVALGLLAPSAATGRWNPATAAAVRRLQSTNGLPESGVVGVATAQLLR